MKVKISKLFLLLCMVITSTIAKAQQFESFQNIEKFLYLTPKELDKKLTEYGYSFESKRIETSMTVKTYLKQTPKLTVNYGYNENQIVMFQWDDQIDTGSYIVENIGDNTNYRVNENKTNDRIGVFYLESKDTDFDVIIFNTKAQNQKGKIGFNLFRNRQR